MSDSRLWVGSIVIDCTDFSRMLSFWSEALHYVPKRPPEGGWVILTDPRGSGPNVSLDTSNEGPLEEYRLHLDLYSSDADTEVARLLSLGATLKRPRKEGEDFTTLADPDGNLFDVIDTPGLKFGEK